MSFLKSFSGLIIAVAVAFLSGAAFIVQQTQSALVFQFGEIVRAPITKPGLYFKVPFLQNEVRLSNQILDLDLPEQTVLTLDRQNLTIDAFARYKITNPLIFYQSLNNLNSAKLTLSSYVNASVRNTLAGASFTAIVRTDRNALMNRIQEDVNKQAKAQGVEIIDVRLTKVNMPQSNSEAVFNRMRSERKQEAAELRATGEQFAATIRARADRDVTQILAEANRKAQESRGTGEGERTRILNEVFNKDPEFFSFVQSLNAYELSLKGENSRLVLSPSSSFFKYLNDPKGKR
jgi:modulator of FtsH protease HflC